jgi:thiol:disulfide interchange protein DsbD
VHIRRSGLGTLLCVVVATRFVLAQSSVVSIALDTNMVSVTAGAEFVVTLNAVIAGGWHINSTRPNEEGLIPSGIEAHGQSITLTKVEYPQAEDLKLGVSENPLSVFRGHCRFTLTFKAAAALQGHGEEVMVILNYQACNDQTCFPPASVTARVFVNINGLPTKNPR